MTDKEKAERYSLIIGYFQKILQNRADKLQEEEIYYDGWKQPRYMDSVERDDEVIDEFLSDMDNIGFYDFAELMAHEVYCERLSSTNEFYDNVYGD